MRVQVMFSVALLLLHLLAAALDEFGLVAFEKSLSSSSTASALSPSSFDALDAPSQLSVWLWLLPLFFAVGALRPAIAASIALTEDAPHLPIARRMLDTAEGMCTISAAA